MPDYAPFSSSVAAAVDTFLKAIQDPSFDGHLQGKQISQDPDTLTTYGLDWTRFYTPNASAVIFPRSIPEVQTIVKAAIAHEIALVPSGGRTGLSGGACATQGEVVISFDKFNKVLNKNIIDQSITVEAGVITAQIQQTAKEMGLFYPVDFASAGSSQIGGNIATNAGGIKVLRYGLTREQVTGLKIVTGTGELLELNHGLIKNATGYDLRQLFIGSEGTLGLIVEATLKLTRPTNSPQVLLLGLSDLDTLMKVFNTFQKNVSLNAFEFFSEAALQKVLNHSSLQRGVETTCPYYALIELDIDSEDLGNKVLELFEQCLESGWVLDGTISQNETQVNDLWALRERISESITPYTPYKNDISITVSKVTECLKELDAIVRKDYPDFEVIWFGHIGDGNLHFNILKPENLSKDDFFEKCKKVSKSVYQVIASFNGSISAEHGVGLLKKDDLHFSRSTAEMAYFRQIKQVFDPHGILNPGKMFDSTQNKP